MSMKHLFLCMALWCLTTAVTHARTFDMKQGSRSYRHKTLYRFNKQSN